MDLGADMHLLRGFLMFWRLRLVPCLFFCCFGLSLVFVRAGVPPKTMELTLADNVKMKLIRIEPGKFMMGSPEDEKDREDNEGPQHEVTLSKPFYMGVYAVTRGQFRAFVNATNHKTGPKFDDKWGSGVKNKEIQHEQREFNWQNTGFEQTDDHPVVNVHWHDAVAFCYWLSRKASKEVKLPTEAQWEYACRAGTKTRFSSGNADASLKEIANIADLSLKPRLTNPIKCPDEDFVRRSSAWFERVDWNDGYPFTAPVGRFKANAWGLYDMHGNVTEWCQDWYSATYYKNSPKTDPQGPDSGEWRVARGGSWLCCPHWCRSAFRFYYDPTGCFSTSGFRVIVSLH
jgi:formylglycine-generating enzyme required for sulfatase activity